MLHHVADHPHPSLEKWCISHDKFLALLNCIESMGLVTTTFTEIINSRFSKRDLQNKVIISFDDCPSALFDFAIPELLRRKMKAVFYMPSQHVGGINIWDIEEHAMESVELMSAEQLKELVNLGMEIGSHGERHIRLNLIAEQEAFQDISNSKKTLESLLKTKIYSFAYPYGKIPEKYSSLLSKAGYQFGVSIYAAFQSNFTLRRFAINETDDLKTIELKLSPKYRMMRFFYDPLLILKNKIFKQ
ncbi:MAG: polysaccharide deacetylase family protein [Pedobacter agri]